jgi:hypothetical protein
VPIAWPPRSPDFTLELRSQLQKCRQWCYLACGKILTTGWTSAALPMEVTSNHNYSM